jgi:hypothetical protein
MPSNLEDLLELTKDYIRVFKVFKEEQTAKRFCMRGAGF